MSSILHSNSNVKLLTLVIYFTLLLFIPASWGQGFFKYQPQLQSTELQRFFSHAEALLPSTLKVHFPEGIEVQFSITEPTPRGRALINSKTPRLALNRSLISDIQEGEQNSKPSYDQKGNRRIHKTMYREALATVLHEMAHLYDHLNLQNSEMRERINWCSAVSSDDQMNGTDCAIYRTIKTTVSTNPYYLEIAGWLMTSNGNGDRNHKNSFRNRSPDPYEIKSSEEHFAVNFEYFILDPEYSCRRPGLAEYFSRHFKVATSVCEPRMQYVDPDANEIDPKTKKIGNLFKDIPFDRLYEIDYLLADSGKSMMSRFGHSMLRLVICAPGQPKGPDCRVSGLPHHLVLSFRAFINTPQINSWAGLMGQYPSRLFVLPFENVITEYTEVEYRSLKSYPLNLNPEEMKRLVMRSLETHWSYDNDYYFVTNNCAAETLNLLKSSLLTPKLIDKRVIYPKELLQVLLKEGLARPIPQNLEQALRDGYYMDSAEKKHLLSYGRFFNRSAGSSELKEFFALPVEKRRARYLSRLKELGSGLSEDLLVSAFQLELFMLQKKRADFNDDVVKSLWKAQTGQVAEALKGLNLEDLYKKSVEAFGALSAPYSILKATNYGIPRQEEIQQSELDISEVRERIQRMRDVKNQAEEQYKSNSHFVEAQKIKVLIDEILFYQP